jgi:hypothetical protein
MGYKSAAHEIAALAGVRLRGGKWAHDIGWGGKSDEAGMRVRQAVREGEGWRLVREERLGWGYKGDSLKQYYEHADGSRYVGTEAGSYGTLMVAGVQED